MKIGMNNISLEATPPSNFLTPCHLSAQQKCTHVRLEVFIMKDIKKKYANVINVNFLEKIKIAL
jgi:hypothetical protein